MTNPSLSQAPSSLSPPPPSSKPKRKPWFRRWMNRRGSSAPRIAATAVEESSSSLELDLQDLAAEVGKRNASSTESSLALMPLSDIQLGKRSKGGSSSSACCIYAVNGFAKKNLIIDSQQHYSVKRPKNSHHHKSTTAAADKQAQALRLLVREATILTQLGNHPNICSLRGLSSTLLDTTYSADFFLLTNRLHPETLEDRIQQWQQQGKKRHDNSAAFYSVLYGDDEHNRGDDDDDSSLAIPNDDTVPLKANYAFQIAKAIRACHSHKIILRDLSPANIGFSGVDPHCVQLFDLGHAQDTTSRQALDDLKKPLVGKRRYMAGEIWTQGKYTPKTDVYSWSMIFYEMCMERKPYHGMSPLEHQKYVCEAGERPPLACYYLPEELEAILMQSWDHDPMQRWSIQRVCGAMQELLLQLDTFLFFDLEGEDDFLFDIYLPCETEDDCISALGDEDDDSDDQEEDATASSLSVSVSAMDGEVAIVEPVAVTPIPTAEGVPIPDYSDVNWILPAECLVIAADHNPCPPDPCFAHVPTATAEPAPDKPSAAKMPSRTSSVGTTTLSASEDRKPVRMVSSAA